MKNFKEEFSPSLNLITDFPEGSLIIAEPLEGEEVKIYTRVLFGEGHLYDDPRLSLEEFESIGVKTIYGKFGIGCLAKTKSLIDPLVFKNKFFENIRSKYPNLKIIEKLQKISIEGTNILLFIVPEYKIAILLFPGVFNLPENLTKNELLDFFLKTLEDLNETSTKYLYR